MVDYTKSFMIKNVMDASTNINRVSDFRLKQLLENLKMILCQDVTDKILNIGPANFYVQRDDPEFMAIKVMRRDSNLPIIFIDIAFLCYIVDELMTSSLEDTPIFSVYESLEVGRSMEFKIDPNGHILVKCSNSILNLTRFIDNLPNLIYVPTPKGSQSHF